MMTGKAKNNEDAGPLLDKNKLWISAGIGIFLLIVFVVPTPQSLVETIEQFTHG